MSEIASCFPLAVTSMCMILICLKIPYNLPFQALQFVLLFSLTGLLCFSLLLFWPASLTISETCGALLLPASICRLLLMSCHFPDITMSGLSAPVFDLGAICFLLMLLHHRRLSLRWAVLYAFNPVMLYGLANPYFHPAQNFLLLGSICFCDRKQWKVMFLLAGMGAVSDGILFLILPFLIRRDNWKCGWIFFLPPILCLLIGEQHDMGNTFAHVFSPPVCNTRLTLMLIPGYVYFHPRVNRRFRNDPVSGCFFVTGIAVLLMPDSFRYLSLLVPFLAIRPTMSWMLLCLIPGQYCFSGNAADSPGLSLQKRIVICLPFYLLFFRDICLGVFRARSPLDPHLPGSVSVIIPARNEAEGISACIKSLGRDAAVREIIVSDGGSEDNTAVLAEHLGAKVIRHTASPENGGGRGGQIRAGLLAARCDVIAIVHADTLPAASAFTEILEVLRRNPMIAGGAVGCSLSAPGWPFRLLEFGNNLRTICLGISFGDQIQFFRRKPVLEQDMFPDIPLMEDLELSLRLHRAGRQIFLFGNARSSVRRWETHGFRRSLLVIRLCSAYLLRRLWGKPDTQAMYRRYYGGR